MNRCPKPIAALLLLAVLGCGGACKNAETSTDQAATPPAETVETAVPAEAPPALPGFPMPAEPAGEHLVLGEVVTGPEEGDTPLGCSVRAVSDGGRTEITLLSAQLNCCTESLRAGVVESDAAVDVRLYEYLPDLCECIHRRSVRLALDLDAGGREVRVFFNAAPSPCGSVTVP